MQTLKVSQSFRRGAYTAPGQPPAKESRVWDGSLIWRDGSEGGGWTLLKHQLEFGFISQSFAFSSGRAPVYKLCGGPALEGYCFRASKDV